MRQHHVLKDEAPRLTHTIHWASLGRGVCGAPSFVGANTCSAQTLRLLPEGSGRVCARVTYKEEEAASEDVCTLTADHKDDLKLAARILRRMPAFSNSTTFGCDYSFTLGEMLDLLDGDE